MNVQEYEQILIKERAYVSKIDKGSSVVLLVSGGLDSMVTYARLLKDLELTIYPLYISRGQRNAEYERASIEYFSNYFTDIYGEDRIKRFKTVETNVPPYEFKDDLLTYMKEKGHPLRDPVIQMIGVQYAISLNTKLEDNIKTILNAGVADDPFPHCTLKAMRANNIAICENLDDWEWVVTSANIDPFVTKMLYDKPLEIKWGQDNDLPLEKTFTCYQPIDGRHCGKCLACTRRKQAFKEAGVEDLTEYGT